MKREFTLLLTLTLISFNLQSQSQAEMTQDPFDSFANADKELNDIYKEILQKYQTLLMPKEFGLLSVMPN